MSAAYSNRGANTILIGYARVSKANGTQLLDLERDALTAAGIDLAGIWQD